MSKDPVKKAAEELIEKYPAKFSKDIEKNKLSLNEMEIVESKVLRNRIAGYITRLKKRSS